MSLAEREVQNKEARNREALQLDLINYLEKAVPRALSQGARRLKHSKKAYRAFVKLPSRFRGMTAYHLGVGRNRAISAQVAQIAGPSYDVEDNILIIGMDKGIEIRLKK